MLTETRSNLIGYGKFLSDLPNNTGTFHNLIEICRDKVILLNPSNTTTHYYALNSIVFFNVYLLLLSTINFVSICFTVQVESL